MSFFRDDTDLQRIGRAIEAHASSIYSGRGVPLDQFAYVLLRPQPVGERPIGTARHANWRSYPCSLVKVFHLVAAQAALAEGRLTEHGELDRAMRDMILWSSNSATNYIIDLLTGTTGDTLLKGEALADWCERRQEINRFFAGLGWPELIDINLDQKLMDDLRYGREKIGLDLSPIGHNRLTPIAMARLMSEIFYGSSLLPEARLKRVRDHLIRDQASPDRSRGAYQLLGYLGGGLPDGSRIWSKAGRTRWLGDARAEFRRHDTIRAILPGGEDFILTVFTQGEAIAEDDGFLPGIGKLVAAEIARI
ncbi:serine hydrolase [Bosea sp. 2KB_26]|uniref:serine hydrolase n=1 Tax=Bosea sp. 2KB_26 TaxID=3237475 RepID=UPI003F8F00F4